MGTLEERLKEEDRGVILAVDLEEGREMETTCGPCWWWDVVSASEDEMHGDCWLRQRPGIVSPWTHKSDTCANWKQPLPGTVYTGPTRQKRLWCDYPLWCEGQEERWAAKCRRLQFTCARLTKGARKAITLQAKIVIPLIRATQALR